MSDKSLDDISNNKANIDFSGVARGAASIGMFAAQEVENQRLAKQAQQWTSENMDHAMRNQLTLDRLATPMAVQGMRDAGVGLGALSGPMKPSSQPSAPAGQMAKEVDFANIAQAMANIRLTNAEAQGKEIENERETTADSVSKDAYLKQLQERIDVLKGQGIDTTSLENLWNSIEKSENFNLGVFKANFQAIEAENSSVDAFTHKLETVLKSAGIDKLLRVNSGIEADLTLKDLSLKMAQAYYYMSMGNEAQANIEHVEHKIVETDQHVQQMQSEGKLTDAQANEIINRDVNTLLENGEVKKAVRAELVGGVNSFMHGFGQGSGAVAGLKFGGLASSSAGLSRLASLAGPSSTYARDAFKSVVAKRIGKSNAEKLYNIYLHDPYRNKLKVDNFGEWIKNAENTRRRDSYFLGTMKQHKDMIKRVVDHAKNK